jgi:hypothetical protein
MALGAVMACRFLIPPETETGSLRLLTGISTGIIGGIAHLFRCGLEDEDPGMAKSDA